jgi:hypothetical protein
MDDFREGQNLTVSGFIKRLETFRFMEYSSCFWDAHYKNTINNSPSPVDQLMFNFFKSPQLTGNVFAWQQVSEAGGIGNLKARLEDDPTYYHGWNGRPARSPGPCSAIYHAADLGLSKIAQLFLDAGEDINSGNCH